MQVPITVDENSIVIDGHHRRKIASEIGIDCPQVVKAGLTDTEKRTLALSLNIDRRHLNREQKRALVERSIKADPQLTDREQARRTGADHKTVAKRREELEKSGEIPHFSERVDPRTGNATQPATRRRDHTEEEFDRLAEEYEKEKEMPATLEHQSPFAVGHALVVPGNGKALAFVGEDGRAASNSETMRDALEWAREHPEQSRTDAADESGLSAGTLGNAYTALRNNHEIYRRNRLVERFDSIAQGLTYVADDLESLTADLERATAEDLEFGREYFEDAMKKLNAFRKQLNAKY